MAGVKRKLQDGHPKPLHKSNGTKSGARSTSKPIIAKTSTATVKPKGAARPANDELIESDTTESENGFYGFSAKESDEAGSQTSVPDDQDVSSEPQPKKAKTGEQTREKRPSAVLDEHGHLKSSSREAHAQQKELAKQRKAAKPNADLVARSKVLWEQLRRKSHVEKEERKNLVRELFNIISGRVKEFVFKHDSVRVIQCALKYANMEQRRAIAKELKGEYRGLAESKYGKHLVAKLVVEGDKEIKDSIISEFYGHIRKMINHPEASWILDDIYRAAATKEQKAAMLREWYGTEFAIFRGQTESQATAVLSDILAQTPEKRKPIMDYLQNLSNQLIQKKLTGFTMLHDALLQYYLNCKPGSEEATEFLEKLKGEGDEEDKDFDLLKNLAFTASGSRVVCLALANGSAKDRRHMLKVYKEMTELLSSDDHGHKVLLIASEVIDDTVSLNKALFTKFLTKLPVPEELQTTIMDIAVHKTARIPLLAPFALETSGSSIPKWLLHPGDVELLKEVQEIRKTTSKKDPAVRRREIVSAVSLPLLATVSEHASALISTTEGCQFVIEVLLAADGDKDAAMDAIISLAGGDPTGEGHVSRDVGVGRMLKSLVQGGHFDAKAKKVHISQPSSQFCQKLWTAIQEHIEHWATGPGVWVILALAEQEGWEGKDALVEILRKKKKSIERSIGMRAAEVDQARKSSGADNEKQTGETKAALSGMKILVQKLG